MTCIVLDTDSFFLHKAKTFKSFLWGVNKGPNVLILFLIISLPAPQEACNSVVLFNPVCEGSGAVPTVSPRGMVFYWPAVVPVV